MTCSNLDNMNVKNVTKKAMKDEYPLIFELVNKRLLPRSEKETTVIGPDLYLMDSWPSLRKLVFLLLLLNICIQ